MHHDLLFLHTITDLDGRLHSDHDDYSTLMIAALLRKLLLDGNPLVDAANRGRHLKLRYEVNDMGMPVPEELIPHMTLWSVEDALDPDTAPFGVRRSMKRDQFLAMPVMIFAGHEVTVRDLIKHVAHVEGGVHAGEPNDDKERALSELGTQMRIGGLPAGRRALLAVGRIASQGLQPLRSRIEQELGVAGAPTNP